MSDVERKIDAAIVRVLLRYFRRGGGVVLPECVATTRQDSDFLVLHWAMSEAIERLSDHVRRNPHETEQVLATDRYEGCGVARGRIDARDTLLAQRRTGDPCRIVSSSPSRHADHGVNRLLVWILKRASDSIERMVQVVASESPYAARMRSIRGAIGGIASATPIADLFRTLRLANRPTAGDVRHAARHRRTIYRLAAAAYTQLRSIERGDAFAISALLHQSVVAPLESWRRFELLTALAIAEAIARSTSLPLELEVLGSGGAAKPLARCGPYQVHWQTRTLLYTEPELEPSEQLAAEICADFRVLSGGDRPDVVVINGAAGRVVSLAEAKFVGGAAGQEAGPFADAVLQLVRYRRGYEPGVLGRSVIAMSRLPAQVSVGKPSDRSPFAVDLDGLLTQKLDRWWSELDA